MKHASSLALRVSANSRGEAYPAVYLWNRPANISNFTPGWDVQHPS
jgi:hypothetical protein